MSPAAIDPLPSWPRHGNMRAMPDELPARHAGGRPSKYRHEYCQQIVDACSRKGYSLTAFAGSIGCHLETLANWARKHEQFFEAVKRAKAARAQFWEDKLAALAGQEKLGGGNAALVIFALKSAAPGEFSERVEHRHQIEGTLRVERVERVIVDPLPELEGPMIEGEVIEAEEPEGGDESERR
jgi:transposase-like protein